MKTYINPQEVRDACLQIKLAGKRVAMVPTMGALHDGHLSLMKTARETADYVVASIFVNPKQFGPNEDFSSYPRTIKEDLAKLSSLGVDAVFMPNANDMYPDGFQTFVDNKGMSSVLCGAYRSGHFQGVLTVVSKLLNMVQPDIAIFGKKDYQQLKVISAMVRDLNMPIEIIGGDIVRESDGLAMSSRNVRLTDEERELAPQIYAGLVQAKELFESGSRDVKELQQKFLETLSSSELKVQYAEIRDQIHLQEFETQIDAPAVFAVAIFLGSVRLIDNIELGQ